MKLFITQKIKTMLTYYFTAAPATHTSFQNCAPFTKYIAKIDGTATDDAEDLD